MVAGMRGISIAELARRTGASYERVIKCAQGKVAQPRGALMADMARVLNVRLAWLRYGEEPMEPDGAPEDPTLRYLKQSKSNADLAAGTREAASPNWSRDLPVYAATPVGEPGEFSLSQDPIETLSRPPGLQSVPDAYGFYVVDENMAPRFTGGELCLVHPHRPPRPGDDVLIILAEENENKAEPPVKAILRRYIRQSGQDITCTQFDPPQEMTLSRDAIRSLHRISPLHELL